jgi:hypothetical protein
MSYVERIKAPGPKKILALDGGGIRGMMTVEILAGIEEMLRKALNRGDDFVLADFFDYVAGTSTGAIIATCISYGMSVAEIRKFYESNGKEMFDKAFILEKFQHLYEKEKLAKKLQEVLRDKETGADMQFGGDKLKTLLLIVMRNATTDSPWPLSNNPYAKYNLPERPDCNLKFPLWQLVRASTAAPVYFEPEKISVGEHGFVFVDGGMTTYNNPAFITFLMATVEPYKLNWPTGEDKMLLVSVGTGTSPAAKVSLTPEEMNLFYNMKSIPSSLMFAALNEQDFLCRSFGKCLAGDPLDREVGDMISIKGPTSQKLFTYMRYNAELTKEGLAALDGDLGDIEPKNVQKLDSVEHITDLQRIGRAVAAKKLNIEHFRPFLGA